MINNYRKYTRYKDIDGEPIYSDSVLMLIYGIPPTFAKFTIYKKGNTWYAHTKDAEPSDVKLKELISYGVAIWEEGFNNPFNNLVTA